MKIFAICGSPNRKGSSHTLAQYLIEGAKAEGAEVEYVNIYDYKISDTWENYFGDALQNNFTKAMNDDMPALKAKMASADIILLVSPIYWYQLSGRLKTFVDRWTDTINPDFSSDLKGKGLALVTSHTGVNVLNASACLQMAMHGTAEFLGLKWLGGVDAPSKMQISSGMNSGHTAIAEDFGRKLARGENLIGMKVFGAQAW